MRHDVESGFPAVENADPVTKIPTTQTTPFSRSDLKVLLSLLILSVPSNSAWLSGLRFFSPLFFLRTPTVVAITSLSFSSWPTSFLRFSQQSGFADSLQLVNTPVIDDSHMKRHFLREPTTTTPFSPNQDPCMVSCTFANAQRALL